MGLKGNCKNFLIGFFVILVSCDDESPQKNGHNETNAQNSEIDVPKNVIIGDWYLRQHSYLPDGRSSIHSLKDSLLARYFDRNNSPLFLTFYENDSFKVNNEGYGAYEITGNTIFLESDYTDLHFPFTFNTNFRISRSEIIKLQFIQEIFDGAHNPVGRHNYIFTEDILKHKLQH